MYRHLEACLTAFLCRQPKIANNTTANLICLALLLLQIILGLFYACSAVVGAVTRLVVSMLRAVGILGALSV
jgi:hypothetical protein